MLAPCDLNFYIVFHGPCAKKKIININNKTKQKFGRYFYPHIHPSTTITNTFHGKP